MAERQPLPSHFECEAAYVPMMYSERGTMRIFSAEEIKAIMAAQGLPLPAGIGERIFPVGLRWRVSPQLGLPVTPFTVWRKVKKSTIAPVSALLQRATGKTLFLNGPFLKIALALKNNTPSDVTVEISTLNSKYQEKGGKKFTVTLASLGTGSLIIDYPNVCGVKLNSLVAVTSAQGITMRDYMNDPTWEAVQVVGLPFKPGSISTDLYETDPQGFTGSLTDPETACIQRAELYRVFVKPSPAIAPDGANLPEFKNPKGDELLHAYKQVVTTAGGKMGTLLDIGEMFEQVYKTAPALLLGKQNNFVKTVQTLGIVDPANPNPKQNGTFENPVCATTLLSATTDCWHALGLGFGTIDFLSHGNPVGGGVMRAAALPTGLNAFDYMVTATFRTPTLELFFDFPAGIKEKWTGFEQHEYAAICHFDLQLPPAPASLQADTVSENRPLHRDDFYYHEVRLSWLKEAIQERSPLCFAIAFKNNVTGEAVKLLNSARPFIPGSPQPYIPARRADANADDPPGREGSSFLRYFHDRSPLPYAGTQAHQYYVAAQNVFGLWSAWTNAAHNLSAKQPQVPRVVSANFTSRTNGITDHIYPASLEMVVNYDWQDRTPGEIQLGGHFFSPPVPGSPMFLPGIMMSNAGGVILKYRIRFSGDTPQLFKLNAANTLEAVPANEGEVIIDNASSTGSSNGNPSTANPDMRSYRVVLKELQLDFSTQSKQWFLIYARASEEKNPALLSEYSTPLSLHSADPLPRVPPVFVPDIKWASLPDATNTSRYHLTFPPIAGASGYAVYRATEMSLRDRLPIVNYPDAGSIFQRRDALNLASAAEKAKAVDAFTRVNTKTITQPEIELEMNGDTQGLFIYAVSSFTDQAVESKLSDWIYVAVPEKITPAPPVLTGLVDKTPVAPKAVLRLSPGAGANTSTLQLFASRNRRIVTDVNTMGPSVLQGPSPGWVKIKLVNGVEEAVPDTADVFHFYKVEQPILPGWAPYFYRAVGIGPDQPGNGKFAGRSASSNLLELLPPVPENAPAISDILITANPALSVLRLSFSTNAYPGLSPHGVHTVFISKKNGQQLFDPLDGGQMPDIPVLQTGNVEPMNKLVRIKGTGNGLASFAFNIPFEPMVSLKVIVTDPLGRKKELPIDYKQPEPASTVIITAISFRRQLMEARLLFKTNVSKVKPPNGQYLLEIFLKNAGGSRSLVSVPMHKIPDTLQLLSRNAIIAGGTAQDSARLFTYTAVFRGTMVLSQFRSPATIAISITDPAGIVTSNQLRI